MAYNKFIKKDGTVMLDLTDTTVSAETLAKDIIAVDKSGNKITGTLTDSPIPIEVSTEEEMNALLENGEVGGIYKYIGETTEVYENNALYLLKEDPLKGTWVFNDVISLPSVNCLVYVRYRTNNIDLYGIGYNISKGFMVYLSNVEESTTGGYSAYSGTWKNEEYKTIEITTLYDDLSTNNNTTPAEWFTWLQANATKQPAKSFTKLILQTDLEEITITENGEYSGEYSKVTVDVESGGSAEFNIAYGDTEPTDTTKLWVKTTEASGVEVTPRVNAIVDDLQLNVSALPTRAYSIACASVGSNIYLFGGYSGSGLNTINVFNTENNTITTLDVTLPTDSFGIGCASVGSNIYLFGGNGSSILNTINVFNTENNTITTLDVTLPTRANTIACASVGSNIYLFGGYGGNWLKTINVFDTETNTITTLSTTLPTAANNIGCASVGSNIYLFGGFTGSYGLNTINVFNTETSTITTLDTTLPTGAYGICAASVGTNIYLFGGRSSSDWLNVINVFNIENNTITTLDVTLPTAANNIGCASVGSNIYLFGGNGSSILNTINKFILAITLPANNILIESTVEENYFDILPNFEIGVKNVYIGNADGIGEKVEASLYKDGAWTNI